MAGLRTVWLGTVLLGAVLAAAPARAGMFDGVAAIEGACTAVAISRSVAITAAHCAPPSGATFLGIPISYQVRANGIGEPDDADGDLLALVLESPLPSSIPVYPIYQGPAPIGSTILFIHRDGSRGYNVLDLAPVICDREAATVQEICIAPGAGPTVSYGDSSFAFDYDDPDGNLNFAGGTAIAGESTLRGGDSGGPSFLMVGKQPYLVGINTYVSGTNLGGIFAPGSLGGGILLSYYQDFLQGFLRPQALPQSITRPVGTLR